MNQAKPRKFSSAVQKSVSVPGKQERFAREVIQKAAVIDQEVEQLLYNALSVVPRLEFLPEALHFRAYQDIVHVGDFDRGMPQPSVVVRMLSLLSPSRGMPVLELSPGVGYASALLAECRAYVFCRERELRLAQKTRHRLDRLGYQNVIIRTGNPELGWPEHAPYDGIISWSPIKQLSSRLSGQLAPGGRLVAPLQSKEGTVLTLWEAGLDGTLSSHSFETLEPW